MNVLHVEFPDFAQPQNGVSVPGVVMLRVEQYQHDPEERHLLEIKDISGFLVQQDR